MFLQVFVFRHLLQVCGCTTSPRDPRVNIIFPTPLLSWPCVSLFQVIATPLVPSVPALVTPPQECPQFSVTIKAGDVTVVFPRAPSSPFLLKRFLTRRGARLLCDSAPPRQTAITLASIRWREVNVRLECVAPVDRIHPVRAHLYHHQTTRTSTLTWMCCSSNNLARASLRHHPQKRASGVMHLFHWPAS
eukprot:TRINITY_DN59411_c0_g1_i1.p1 TRINITY_DN59411_c0_g1~~TRINITY_DN59411_c0_g1_i1.p1  ORF type:complete len:190 (+),score=3.85 TRINITY_DN59411_c0_g1_i1:194-763(+)